MRKVKQTRLCNRIYSVAVIIRVFHTRDGGSTLPGFNCTSPRTGAGRVFLAERRSERGTADTLVRRRPASPDLYFWYFP